MKSMFSVLLSMLFLQAYAQSFIVRDIKSFGAKGDGKTNDHVAFERAASFFNKRGGHGKLIISKGTYIVGKQAFTRGRGGKPAYLGADVLHFDSVKNLTIEGALQTKVRYVDSLRIGAFDPETGDPHKSGRNFTKYAYAAIPGMCIYIGASQNVTIKNLELDGNNQGVILGGIYGDVGRQLSHYGIFIRNSRSITVDKVTAHHFALDGISVANKASKYDDDIKLLNSVFEYNSRQGLSWIGGNDLKVKNCKFNHTGKAAFSSPPGAGVDIEAEVGPIRNGRFEDCEFINNKGCGLVADNGNSANCEFKECTFWGINTWSIWVTKPGYIFKDSKIYGSFVHGANATTDEAATKFIDCHFEDKPYNGKEPYGKFLVESNNRKRVTFRNCSFVSHKKKLLWVQGSRNLQPEEKYQFYGCSFTINNNNLPKGDFVAVIRSIRYKNNTFTFTAKEAKEKKYYLNSCCGNMNVDEGGNKIIYK